MIPIVGVKVCCCQNPEFDKETNRCLKCGCGDGWQ